jgi:carbohydrate diacid regulator
MLLSTQIANRIVNEVNAVIPLKINIMDQKGIIVASSNPARIGSFHGGAYRIIKSQVDEIIVHYDGEYKGALKGINYPLRLQRYIVGVIGITGEYDEIVQSALIIKRMTELLLENAYSIEQKQMISNICNRYLAEWFSGETKNITPDFINQGKLLGFDITVPRRILVCGFYRPGSNQDIVTMQIIEEVENYVKKLITGMDPLNIYYKTGSTLVCAVAVQTDESAEKIAKELKKRVEEQFPIKVAIGIDSREENFTYIQAAFSRAQKANEACMRTHKHDIRFYDDLNMEVFSDQISEHIKIEFIHRIFKGFSEGEIRKSMVLLEVYYDMEGALNKAADRLFIHKNTLQYRLRSIMERTGYDPRSIRHSSLFYIAIYFYREIYESH